MKNAKIILLWAITMLLGSIIAPALYQLRLNRDPDFAYGDWTQDYISYALFSIPYSVVYSLPGLVVLLIANYFIRKSKLAEAMKSHLLMALQIIVIIGSFAVLDANTISSDRQFVNSVMITYATIGILLWSHALYKRKVIVS